MSSTDSEEIKAQLHNGNMPPSQLQQEPPVMTYPEGGLKAWIVTIGAATALFSTFGYVNSFGVYQEYYEAHQLKDHSPSQIAWIGSIQLFFQYITGVVAGPMFDRLGAKIMYPPAVIYIISIMLNSLCKEYYQFILTQGVLGGICIGMVFTPAAAVVNHYFKKNIGAALGVVVAGSSVGGVIFPVLLNNLLNKSTLGFGWSVRIVGFLILFMLSISCLAIKERYTNIGKKPDPASFKRPIFFLTVAAIFFMVLGIFTPFFYLVSFSISKGMSRGLAGYMIAVLNAASFMGRVVSGILADKLGRYNMLIFAAFSSGILLFCWQLVETNPAIIVFTILYGFCSGSIVSLMNACIAQITPDPGTIGAHIGFLLGVCSFAGLAGTPISGALLSKYGSFTPAGEFAGATTILGGIILVFVRFQAEKSLFKAF